MQTLGDLATSFQLYAVCETCQRVARLDLGRIAAREGWDYPVTRLRMRLLCGRCHTRTHALRIVYVGPQGRAGEFHYGR